MKKPVSFYSERIRLVGDVFTPDDLRAGERRAGIVLCHGYTGVKDLYLPDNARALNEAGYVAMTFDYKGWRESGGPRSRLAPHSRVADAPAPASARRMARGETPGNPVGCEARGGTRLSVATGKERA